MLLIEFRICYTFSILFNHRQDLSFVPRDAVETLCVCAHAWEREAVSTEPFLFPGRHREYIPLVCLFCVTVSKVCFCSTSSLSLSLCTNIGVHHKHALFEYPKTLTTQSGDLLHCVYYLAPACLFVHVPGEGGTGGGGGRTLTCYDKKCLSKPCNIAPPPNHNSSRSSLRATAEPALLRVQSSWC